MTNTTQPHASHATASKPISGLNKSILKPGFQELSIVPETLASLAQFLHCYNRYLPSNWDELFRLHSGRMRVAKDTFLKVMVVLSPATEVYSNWLTGQAMQVCKRGEKAMYTIMNSLGNKFEPGAITTAKLMDAQEILKDLAGEVNVVLAKAKEAGLVD